MDWKDTNTIRRTFGLSPHKPLDTNSQFRGSPTGSILSEPSGLEIKLEVLASAEVNDRVKGTGDSSSHT